MSLYKLDIKTNHLSSGVLEKIIMGNIDYEKDFENWLENSPNALLEEVEGDTLIWIGRQVRATIGDSGKYLDLLGIDSSGDLVIVELKKGKTPRDVIAQALEYSAWASSLSYDDLNKIAIEYFKTHHLAELTDLTQAYRDVFYPDAEEEIYIEFNRNQKIYIVAEEITQITRQVTSHLRTKYNMKILCVEYKVFRSEQGEYIISTEKIGSFDDLGVATINTKTTNNNTERWNQPIKVKDTVHKAVKTITKGNISVIFSPTDIYKKLIKEYPSINRSTVGCQLIADCVNHTSRRHYPSGQQDLYFIIDKGKYRLYDAQNDGEWDWEGKPLS